MKSRPRIITGGLFTLLLGATLGLILTNDSCQHASSVAPRTGRLRPVLVDERPFHTAQAVAQRASTPEEKLIAEDALASADDEVDLAFTSALRGATEEPPVQTPEGRALNARLNSVSARVKADQDQADLLTKQLTRVIGPQHEAIEAQVEMTRAQLQLDQDELQNAKEDLIRSGNDVAARIHKMQHEFERHKLSQQHGIEGSATDAVTSGADTGYAAGNLVAQIAAWYALSGKVMPLWEALDEASQRAETLAHMHALVEMQASQTVSQLRPRRVGSPPNPDPKSVEQVTASLRHLAVDQHGLADLSKRREDEQDLREDYANWIDLVQSRERIALRGIVRSVLWILLIIPSIYLSGRAADRLLASVSQKHPNLTNLRAILHFALQASGVLLVLVVILGMPQQLPAAIFGVVGAGLTVALKDFSVVFIDNRIRDLLNPSAKQGSAAGNS
jgi:hypothetical protein